MARASFEDLVRILTQDAALALDPQTEALLNNSLLKYQVRRRLRAASPSSLQAWSAQHRGS